MDGPSVLYLGSTAEAVEPHWGGAPRRCVVVARPLLARGDRGWVVDLDEPIPATTGEALRQVVLAERLVGQKIDLLRSTTSAKLGEGWVPVLVCRPRAPDALQAEPIPPDALSIEYWAEVALAPEALPPPDDPEADWERTLTRIQRFIERHGHSKVPEPYFDEDGRLDVIVGNLRWHHAGKAGISPGPFPGIDYARQLDDVVGWEW